LEGWTGTIEDDMMVAAIWTPDSRQIITFTDLQLRATVWNLTDSGPTAYLKSPKLVAPKGVDFSSNGKFMALVERKDCKDWISIYYAGLDFKLINAFEISSDIFDAQDCKWSMKNTAILVQDSSLESRFVLYSAMTGRPIAIHTPNSHAGLGIRNLLTSPSGNLVACGMFDTNLGLFNNIT
jgi:WD40 repeat protein